MAAEKAAQTAGDWVAYWAEKTVDWLACESAESTVAERGRLRAVDWVVDLAEWRVDSLAENLVALMGAAMAFH